MQLQLQFTFEAWYCFGFKKKTGILLPSLLLLLTFSSVKASMFTDDFLSPDEVLIKRKTAPDFGAWEGSPDFLISGGHLTLCKANVTSEKIIRMALPSLNGKTKIRLVFSCRSSGSEIDSKISFGFTSKKDPKLLTNGALWAIDRSDNYLLMYMTGPGVTAPFEGSSWYDKFYRDNAQETVHNIEYSLVTGNVTASVSNNKNKHIVADDVPVSWDGILGQRIPLENLAYFTISYYQQNGLDTDSIAAAYISHLEIEVR